MDVAYPAIVSFARLAIVLACLHVYSETKSKAILFIGLAFTASLIAGLASLASALKAVLPLLPLSSEVRAYLSLALSALFTSLFVYGMVLLAKELRR
jgi:hypothetical protein